MKKVLITGGLGYVGGRISKRLLQTGGYELYIATRKRKEEVQHLFSSEQVSFVDALLLDTDEYNLPEDLDAVMHLAAYNEIDSAADPVAAAEYNIVSSLRLLQKAVKSGVKQFIYFSTAHVYGAPLQGTITEETLPRPVHPYAITHKAFEDFVLAARDKNEIDGVVIRLSNSFGVPIDKNVNRWTLLVNDLCRQGALSNKLKLNSNGLQERDFVTLTDVAEAVLHILQLPANKKADGLFNLGGNYTMSIMDMTKLIKQRAEQLMNKNITIVVPEVDAKCSGADVTALNFSSEKLRNTGFEWSKNVTEEIDSLLAFCKKAFLV